MSSTQRVRGTSEIDILSRAIKAKNPALSASAARSLLAIHFTPADQDRMSFLSKNAREGTVTDEEQVEIDNYERSGRVLSLLKLKARQTLKRSASNDRSQRN